MSFSVRFFHNMISHVSYYLSSSSLCILDLQSVTSKVAAGLKDADASLQSSLATVSSGSISDDDREKIMKQLGE